MKNFPLASGATISVQSVDLTIANLPAGPPDPGSTVWAKRVSADPINLLGHIDPSGIGVQAQLPAAAGVYLVDCNYTVASAPHTDTFSVTVPPGALDHKDFVQL